MAAQAHRSSARAADLLIRLRARVQPSYRVLRTTTDVGAYAQSQSALGTFDQAANLWEWNETIGNMFPGRGIRGASFISDDETRASAKYGSLAVANVGDSITGFRVARIPEPAIVYQRAAKSRCGWLFRCDSRCYRGYATFDWSLSLA